MAYRNSNKLHLILRVQEIYTEKKSIGLSNEYIFSNFIAPVFFIGRSSFYNYLSTPAKKLIKNQKQMVNN